MADRITILGIDAATQPENIGLACGRLENSKLTISGIARGSKLRSPVETLTSWVEGPTLLAIDAPLGWPAPLGRELASHRAGQVLETSASVLFRRATDCFVHATLGKTPLEVGANLIARTAEAALRLLGQLRARVGAEIPLLWAPRLESVAAIEVYPAATLIARGIDPAGYKGSKPKHLASRYRIAASLAAEAHIEVPTEQLTASDHCLDAALCVLAGADFLAGRSVAPAPEQRETAEIEGWIWFPRPTSR